MVWDKLAAVFPYVWSASAFKGAFGETLYIPNVKRHLENNLRWLEVMGAESPKFKGGFRGIALTGWQRWVSAVGGISLGAHYGADAVWCCRKLPPCPPSGGKANGVRIQHSKWAKNVSNWEDSAFVVSDWWKWQTVGVLDLRGSAQFRDVEGAFEEHFVVSQTCYVGSSSEQNFCFNPARYSVCCICHLL